MNDTAHSDFNHPIPLHPGAVTPLRPLLDAVATEAAAGYADLRDTRQIDYTVAERVVRGWCWEHWRTCPHIEATLVHPTRRAIRVNAGHL